MVVGKTARSCPVSVVDLDVALIPATPAKKRGVPFRRVLKGRVVDPVWLCPERTEIVEWLSDTTDIVFLTERRSVEISGSRLPFHCAVISSGGFTIEYSCGKSDPEWRRMRKACVDGDQDRFNEVLSEAWRDLGDPALSLSVLEQDGLPYAISIPRRISHLPHLRNYLRKHQYLRDFVMKDGHNGTIMRRDCTSHEKALAFLLEKRGHKDSIPVLRFDMCADPLPHIPVHVPEVAYRADPVFQT